MEGFRATLKPPIDYTLHTNWKMVPSTFLDVLEHYFQKWQSWLVLSILNRLLSYPRGGVKEGGIIKDGLGGDSGPVSNVPSFAKIVQDKPVKKVVKITDMRNSEVVDRAFVAIALEAVEEVSSRFANTLYGYFIGKILVFSLVENYVKNTWAKYGLKRIQLHEDFFLFQFDSKEGMESMMEHGPWLIRLVPMMLNVWTPNTDLKKDEISKAPIWVKLHHMPIMAYSEVGLRLITTQMRRPIMNGKGHTLATVDIEYEWTLARCSTCLIFYHVDDKCPKRPKVDAPTKDTDDGFVEVKRKKSGAKTKNRQIEGIKLHKPALNLHYRRVEKGDTSKANAQGDTTKKTDNAQNHSVTGMSTNEVQLKNLFSSLGIITDDETDLELNNKGVDSVLNDSDSQEIEELILDGSNRNNTTVTGASTPADTRLCSMVFRHWDWTSNGSSYSKGTRIILGWNHNEVDVAVINLNDQYRPWCILGYFNSTLFLEDSTSRSSSFNISMREFKECVEEIEVVQILKYLKKPLRKLLYEKGNLHTNVTRLRDDLDRAQICLDADSFNVALRENKATTVAVKSRISRSRIDVVTCADGTTVDNEKVVDAFVSHYEQFLGLPGITSPFDTTDLFSTRLTDDHARDMICVISRHEVKDALFFMGNDKSPGPDGYTAAFFKESWEIIADDFFDAVNEFFINGKLLKELNHTIIALILKIRSPSRVTGYLPISCCNVLFKCISKIIANRIKESLKLLVSPNQSSICFWEFLKEVLVGFGFHARMIDWIIECVTTTSFSISISGSLHGFFKGKRGLRQDNLFLFAHGDVDSAIMIKDALEEFKNVSGLTPSLPKKRSIKRLLGEYDDFLAAWLDGLAGWLLSFGQKGIKSKLKLFLLRTRGCLNQVQRSLYALVMAKMVKCMTRSSTKELFTPFKDLEQEFRSSRKHFKTLSLDESRSPNFNLISDQEEYSKEEVTETMAETMEQYMSKTRADYGSRVSRPKIEDNDNFELKGQFLKEL
ncbi:RNA-directed DNA polymerase, eukaryota, reverse transcriptase zinc-binding domain protein [Tanacetum coccineum]|uniref:RNA-directed DNA polymerase, eukaryota, reverse transcriptase zinc-binding domain protein n=1 Tax=Tanacetum coccineum TaxID=301880 RepID=A0ABQ5IYN8_9ASTR